MLFQRTVYPTLLTSMTRERARRGAISEAGLCEAGHAPCAPGPVAPHRPHPDMSDGNTRQDVNAKRGRRAERPSHDFEPQASDGHVDRIGAEHDGMVGAARHRTDEERFGQRGAARRTARVGQRGGTRDAGCTGRRAGCIGRGVRRGGGRGGRVARRVGKAARRGRGYGGALVAAKESPRVLATLVLRCLLTLRPFGSFGPLWSLWPRRCSRRRGAERIRRAARVLLRWRGGGDLRGGPPQLSVSVVATRE